MTQREPVADELTESFDQLTADARHFLVKLIERSTSMAAHATLAVARPQAAAIERHTSEIVDLKQQISELMQRLEALEQHVHARQNHRTRGR